MEIRICHRLQKLWEYRFSRVVHDRSSSTEVDKIKIYLKENPLIADTSRENVDPSTIQSSYALLKVSSATSLNYLCSTLLFSLG